MALVLLAGCAHAPPPALPAGVWSNVVRDPETGDRDGFEVGIRPGGWAEVIVCEGRCRPGLTGPIDYRDGRLAFTLEEVHVVQGTRREFHARYRFEGRLAGERLFLDRSDRPGFEPQVLRRVAALRTGEREAR